MVRATFVDISTHKTLTEIMADRGNISYEIKATIDEKLKDWGISFEKVALENIVVLTQV